MSREITLEIAAREYVWLWDRRHGISIEAIAAREGKSIARVRFGVARARAQENSTGTANLVPPAPPGAFVSHRGFYASIDLCSQTADRIGLVVVLHGLSRFGHGSASRSTT